MKKKKIAILGSTGSIGKTTLEVVKDHPEDFKVMALAAKGSNLKAFAEQVQRHQPEFVYLENETALQDLKTIMSQQTANKKVHFFGGTDELEAFIDALEVDLLISAFVGFAGLKPTLQAIRKRIPIALANKEVLVAAGEMVMSELKNHKTSIIPIDSEHSAIFQCLQGESYDSLKRIVLTASGGSLRNYSMAELKIATKDQALKHPNWEMGQKVTIDSATMFNKGLELIEAKWLFNLPSDQIDVWIHPSSLAHSFVEFQDGSMKAQLGLPTMYVPIQYSLYYPHRAPSKIEGLHFDEILDLSFSRVKPPFSKAIELARHAVAEGSYLTCCLNAANEVAVSAFLEGRIRFLDIYAVVEDTLTQCEKLHPNDLDALCNLDKDCRHKATLIVKKISL